MRTFRQMVDAVAVTTVEVDGEQVAVRQLSGFEQAMVARLVPPPSPPMIEDPDGGSLAPPIPNHDDPAFLAASEAWHMNHTVALASAAVGHRAIGIAEEWPEVDERTHGELTTVEKARAFVLAARPVVGRLPWRTVRTISTAAIMGRRPDEPADAVAGRAEKN